MSISLDFVFSLFHQENDGEAAIRRLHAVHHDNRFIKLYVSRV